MLEKNIEKQLVQAVKNYGGKAYKFVSPNNSGVPDRLVILPNGAIGFVELKNKGCKPSKLQIYQLQKLADMNCKVYVLDNVKDILKILEDIKSSNKSNNKINYYTS